MVSSAVEEPLPSLLVQRDVLIEASLEITWEAVLAEMGPEMETPERPMPMVLEAWPGGRWFRDLGNNSGHLWGFVQVIKPPTLIEIYGPMFMSFPAVNHFQYRLTSEGSGTRLKLTHRAVGQIPPEISSGVSEGWNLGLKNIAKIAARLKAKK